MTARPAARRTRHRRLPARAGWPSWLFDHHPLGLALAGLSAVLAIALWLDTPLHRLTGDLDPALHRVFAAITRIGKSDWSILLAAGLCLGFALRARRAARPRDAVVWRHAAGLAGFVLAALLTSGIAANVLKWGLGRARPSLSDGAAPFDFAPIATSAGWASFPSGHATTIVALAVALGFIWPRLRLAFLTLALWVAVSRVMVGAHWLSDVVAGAALGAATAYALRLWLARRAEVFVPRPGRLSVRTGALGPLFRREAGVLSARVLRLAGKLEARLTGAAVPRPADRSD
jgi:undecaprenyl-diphosphatase